MNKVKLPKGALRLVAQGCHAHVEFADVGGKKEPKLRMTIYSGKFIDEHWYWGKLGIDLKGIKFDRPRYPVLENHWTDAKIGHMGKPKVNGNLTVDSDSFKFLRTDASLEFQKNSEDGFPYQASMYAIPKRVERIERGASAEVNGLTLHGPGTIWRECLFQEASVCVFGWDKKTEASVFSKEETEVDIEYIDTGKGGDEETLTLSDDETGNLKTGEEVNELKITLEQLQKDSPELLAQIQADAVAAMTETFKTEKKTLEDTVAALTAEKTALVKEKDDFAVRVDKLEKKDHLRDQASLKATADVIWDSKLSASELPQNRFEKIKQHVRFKDYLDTEGKLDVDKFSTAVDAEIKEWESDEPGDVRGGTGGFGRQLDANADKEKKLAEDNAKRSNALLAAAGQVQKK